MLPLNNNYNETIPFWNQCLSKFPNLRITYDISSENTGNPEEESKLYNKVLRSSWNNDINLCLLEKALEDFPPQSIFFVSGYYYDYPESVWNKYIEYLKK